MARVRPIALAAKVALLLCSLALPFAAWEAYLRIWDPVTYRAPPEPLPGDAWRELLHVRSPVPGLAYELAPNHHLFATGTAIATNARGMRSYEVLARRAGVYRIAVVGDSYAFGFGTPMAETFPAELEVALNEDDEPGREYEVLNYGVGGYSSQDEALVVEHKVLRDDPDLILLAYSLNDPEDAPVQPVHSYYQDASWWQYSHALRKIALTYLQWQIRHFGAGSYIRYLYREPHKWHSVVDAFDRIGRLAGERHVPVVVVVFPHGDVDSWDQYPYADLHRQVIAEARAHGFRALDLLSAFARKPPLAVRLSRGDDHPNARGHRIAALAIKDFLRAGPVPAREPVGGHQRDGVAPPFL